MQRKAGQCKCYGDYCERYYVLLMTKNKELITYILPKEFTEFFDLVDIREEGHLLFCLDEKKGISSRAQ